MESEVETKKECVTPAIRREDTLNEWAGTSSDADTTE